MDIPRLNAKSIAVDLVNDAIKDACLFSDTQQLGATRRKQLRSSYRERMSAIPCPRAKGNRFTAAQPGVFDFLKFALSSGNHLAESPSICVVSSLIALMKDQVAKFTRRA